MPMSGYELLKHALKNGWSKKKGNGGSHQVVEKPGFRPVSIPVHRKEMKKGTESDLLKQLGLKKP